LTLQLTEPQLESLRELRDKRAEVARLTKDVERLREELLAAFIAEGTDTALTASGAAAAHIQHQVRRVVNAAKLEALHPEVYEEVFEERDSLVLKVDYDD
jgi:uncharacterized protein (DUF1501 family)